jgi:acyl-CoA synthetase (AMP-forming)/AMP-acid ligase II
LDCDLNRRWTCRQVHEAALNVAAAFINEFGVKKGEIVCFYVPNSDIHAISLLSVIAAGGVYCGLSPLLKYRKI